MADRTPADKVATQHHLIESLLAGVADALAAGDGAGAADALAAGDGARAAARAGSLRRALEAHFLLEEEHYFPAARASRPALETELAGLAEEHVRMRDQLAELTARLADGDADAAARCLRALDTAFRRHEKVEQKLLAG